jgi:hypothetical protein
MAGYGEGGQAAIAWSGSYGRRAGDLVFREPASAREVPTSVVATDADGGEVGRTHH